MISFKQNLLHNHINYDIIDIIDIIISRSVTHYIIMNSYKSY